MPNSNGAHYTTKELVEQLHEKFDRLEERVDERLDKARESITRLWIAVFSIAGAMGLTGTLLGITGKFPL